MDEDNLIQTFQLESVNLRGRILRLGQTIDTILNRHAHPDPIVRLIGEAAGLALLLSSMLKYDGIFTLQVQGDGSVMMVVADVTNHSDIRACARIRPDADFQNVDAGLAALLGEGHLAFTVDQGEDTDRYQGIVALTGVNLQECIHHYFSQSEQVMTGIRFALDRDEAGQWRAGGIIIQRLPDAGAGKSNIDEDDWRRVMVLLQSCSDKELLDKNLSQNDLLFRLFHEEGIRVYDPEPVSDVCRCSRSRAENILRAITPEERIDLTVDGHLDVTCEFCSRSYDFDAATFEK